MTEKERKKRIKAQIRKSAQELFEAKPKAIEEELENTMTFGSPDNLAKSGKEPFDEEDEKPQDQTPPKSSLKHIK